VTRLDVGGALRAMAERRPLVHHITNWVTISDCAQVTRRWGCLPVMAHACEEVEEMVALARALVLNIGTLTPELVDAMLVAARKANSLKVPVILDAVGAGATRLRTEQALRLLGDSRIDILKGNAGEIATLAGVRAEVRGVESISVGSGVAETAKALAAKLGNVVAVTGRLDYVSDGRRVWAIGYGHEMMGRIVGTGCMSTSTVGCFAAAGGDLPEATARGLAAFKKAGELAALSARGPGEFVPSLFDAIDSMARAPEGLVLEAEEVAA